MSDIELDLLREFGTTTFSTEDPEHKALGWTPTDDPRDYDARPYVLRAEGRTSGRQLWLNPLQSDQGREGACVGAGTWGLLNSMPHPHNYANSVLFDIYHAAQEVDGIPGSNYQGTTVRAGLRVIRDGLVPHVGKHIKTYAFTDDVEVLALHILNNGPATIGVDWFAPGMDRVDNLGFIRPTGEVRGGHCVVVDGVTWDYKDVTPNRFRIRNSWGPNWGFNGRCRISAADLQLLFNRGGTAGLAVEVA